MGYMLSHYSYYLNLPPLPYKAMISMLNNNLNLPPICPAKQWATC